MTVFGVVFWIHSGTSSAAKKAETARVAQGKAALEAQKQQTVQKARADADKRSADRLAEEQRIEADKRAKWDAAGARIAMEISEYQTRLAKNGARARELENELTALRARRQALSEKAFSMTHEIETFRITKRTTEIEIQRLTELLARTAANSSLATVP